MRLDFTLVKNVLKGSLTYVPGLYKWLRSPTGGTDSALYCYGVWMRHLLLGHQRAGMSFPKVVAELGPGDSMGTSLAALISGAEKVLALDVIRYSQKKRNLQMFDELVAFFKRREPVPSRAVFPNLKPDLEFSSFPHFLLSDAHLKRCLDPVRLSLLRRSIETAEANDSIISYRVPWDSAAEIEPASVDFIFSQAVLEHVRDLKSTFCSLSKWLKPSGVMSHQIDFKSHGITKEWNGHWQYSQTVWRLVMGRRPYLLNREPSSSHIAAIQTSGFEILHTIEEETPSLLHASRLAAPYKNLSNHDIVTSGLYVLARKKPGL